MAKKSKAKVELPPIGQIGLLVKDANKTAEYFSSIFGIGPFLIRDTGAGNDKMRIAVAPVGPIDFELIQVLEGCEYYTKCLREKGEGLHHLGIFVKDLATFDEILGKLAAQGIKQVFGARLPTVAAAYLEETAIGGVTLELIWMEKRTIQR